MKRIFITLLALVLAFNTFSQQDVKTQVANILGQLPAQSTNDLDKTMAAFAELGEPAILAVAANLVPPGEGDDASSRYAISGLVKYLAKGNDVAKMQTCSKVLCKAIENSKNEEVIDFLLQELQYLAGDEAIPTTKNYLLNKRLCDPAARVLLRIDTQASKMALVETLPRAEMAQQIIIVQSIGTSGCVQALGTIQKLATSSDLKLKKVALRALADIGDLSSAPILKAEAKKAGYSFEPTDATASYLLLIQSAARNGNALFVEESCKDIVDNQSIPVQTRSAALRILVKAASNKSTPELQKALKSSDIEYRTDAENLLAEIKQTVPYQLSDEEAKEGFVPLFNGLDMKGWVGNTTDYIAQHGEIICRPSDHGSGNLYTEKEYADFTMRFEFQLTPGANNGLGIRTPLEGDAAYVGMELQILDNEADIYKDLKPYQYHGSVYGVIPAKRGFQKPVGEWNYQEVQCVGNKIKVILNGEVILDGDIAEASKNGTETADHKSHPGLLNKSGHIGFLGHGSPLKFRNLRIFSK